MSDKTATCERTGEKILLREGFFTANPASGEWVFISKTAPEEHGDYPVPASELVNSVESFVDWMAHLAEKTWFVPVKFFAFFTRFREANKLYGL